MCARVWQLKCACTRAGDAIPICSTIAANGVLQLTRVGSVHASVQPCRSRGSVPASKPGSEDLLERRERRRERRCARPRPPTRARISSWSHRCTRTTLTRACARDEQMVARDRLIRHRRQHGRRRRRHLSCSAAYVTAAVAFQRRARGGVCARHPGPRQRPQAASLLGNWVFFRWGLLWVSVGCGGIGQKRIRACRVTSLPYLHGPQ